MSDTRKKKLDLMERQQHGQTASTPSYGTFLTFLSGPSGAKSPPASTTMLLNAPQAAGGAIGGAAVGALQGSTYEQNLTGSATSGQTQAPNTGATTSPDTSAGSVADTSTSTSADANAGTTTKNSTGAIDTYEQFLANKQAHLAGSRDATVQFYDEQSKKTLAAIEAQRQTAYAAAERQRAEVEKNAEVARERGIVDSRSSYAQNMSAYGARAEALADMGLTGGGYSDYLNAQAYAQHRSETQAANAQAEATKRQAQYTADQAQLSADATAADAKLKAEQAADEGKFKAEMSYQEGLFGIETDRETHRQEQAATNAEIAESLGDTVGAIQGYVASGKISAADGQKQTHDYFASLIDQDEADGTTTFDATKVEEALKKGYITGDQYTALKNKWSSGNEISKNFFLNDEGAQYTRDQAKEILDNFSKHPWCSTEDKEALQVIYDELYKPATVSGTWTIDGSVSELEDEGNDFSVKLDGTEYPVESAGETTDENIVQVASDLSDGTVFGYKNDLYVKDDGRVFKLGYRYWYQDEWTALKKKVFSPEESKPSAVGYLRSLMEHRQS